MKISTETLKNVSLSLSNDIQYILFDDVYLNNGHAKILDHMQQLSNYFNQSAIVLETNEQSMSSLLSSGYSKSSTKYDWNAISILQKKEKPVTITKSYEYSVGQVSTNVNKKYLQSGASIEVMDFLAKGKCQFYVWKDKLFNPKALLEGNVSFSILTGSLYTKLGTNNINAYLKARGDAGVVYGNASAVICKDEQTLDIGLGAALLRGEVSLAFNLFGASVTLKGSGSLGSAEMNMSYSHKNREWEMGTNLGFIAGLGFDIKVVY